MQDGMQGAAPTAGTAHPAAPDGVLDGVREAARLSVAPMMDWTDFIYKTETCNAECALDVLVLIAEFRALA